MRILYVAPYPPLKNGVADYAYYFKKAMEQNLDIQMDILDIFQNENIYSINKFLSLGNQIISFKLTEKYNLIHFEIGVGQNREFYILHFVKKYHPLIKTVVTLHDPPRVLSAPIKFIGLENMPRAIRGIRKLFDLTVGKYWENKKLRDIDCVITLTEKGKYRIEEKLKCNVYYLPLLSYRRNISVKRYRDKVEKILFFGYLGSKKGVDILIKSFAKLISFNSEYKNIKLYICGGIPEGGKKTKFYDYLLNLPSNLGIPKSVIFTGRISDQEKEFYLNDSDILVLPYRKHGTFGASSVLIEGMSYGLSIIVSDTKSFNTEVQDGKTALLFENGNVEMLYKKIKLLVENKELRQRLGNNAREHILKEHNWECVANKMKRIYENVL